MKNFTGSIIEVVIDEENTELWSSLFTNNRVITNGLALEYIPPQLLNAKPIVHLDKDEVNLEIQKWNIVLIVYFIGDSWI